MLKKLFYIIISFSIIPSFAFAATDISTYPKYTPFTYAYEVDSTDVANCIASNPADDRFVIFTNTGFQFYVTSLLFTSISGVTTISTTTPPSLSVMGILCADGDPTNGGSFDYGGINEALNTNFTSTSGNGGLFLAPPSGSSTPTEASTTIISNPAQDLFNGILLFFIAFIFIVWYFTARFKLS